MIVRPIRVLASELVGRIAAGEVVERPASAIKELIENALDAGARHVEISVEGGVLGVLRVADDGEGIAAAQLGRALERHATSKIAASEDLERIATLGFRGEGLAAIAAVARVRLVSRPEGQDEAAEVFAEDGRIGETRPAARSRGTTVEIRDLFFSTPARRKFLKSPSAELRAVVQLVQAYALAHPECGFVLVVDGRDTVKLPAATDLHERVGQVLGAGRVARMIPILIEEPGLDLSGFLGAPEDSRVRAGNQVFVLNGRWIQSVLLRQAVRAAYGDLIPPGRHPEAVLHLRLPENEVDVNVHPTKREVRLLRERELYPRIIRLLRLRVEGRFPSLKLRDPGGAQLPDDALPGLQQSLHFHAPLRPGAGASLVGDGGSEPDIVPFPGAAPAAAPHAETAEEAPSPNLWQLHETYVFARIPGGVLIIDQHAAHERVLFEEAMRRFRGEAPLAQELLFPTVVELAPDEFPALLECLPALEKLGFHLEHFGGTSVLVHAIPAGLREWRQGALLRDVLDHLSDLPDALELHEKVARSVACHGAVKAGQRLSHREIRDLVDQLLATEKPQGDPHGRPVFLHIDLRELHRRFGRSG